VWRLPEKPTYAASFTASIRTGALEAASVRQLSVQIAEPIGTQTQELQNKESKVLLGAPPHGRRLVSRSLHFMTAGGTLPEPGRKGLEVISAWSRMNRTSCP